LPRWSRQTTNINLHMLEIKGLIEDVYTLKQLVFETVSFQMRSGLETYRSARKKTRQL
jgi:hypothetical protein